MEKYEVTQDTRLFTIGYRYTFKKGVITVPSSVAEIIEKKIAAGSKVFKYYEEPKKEEPKKEEPKKEEPKKEEPKKEEPKKKKKQEDFIDANENKEYYDSDKKTKFGFEE